MQVWGPYIYNPSEWEAETRGSLQIKSVLGYITSSWPTWVQIQDLVTKPNQTKQNPKRLEAVYLILQQCHKNLNLHEGMVGLRMTLNSCISCLLLSNARLRACVAAPAFNPSIGEAEAGRLLCSRAAWST